MSAPYWKWILQSQSSHQRTVALANILTPASQETLARFSLTLDRGSKEGSACLPALSVVDGFQECGIWAGGERVL